MSNVSCRFCFHGNPSGARFCNECGSPLNLKPCRRCEAVNDAFAEHCHQCGMPFAPDAGPDAAAAAEGTKASSVRDSPFVPALGETSKSATTDAKVAKSAAPDPKPTKSTADASAASPLAAAVADRIPVALARRHPNLERLIPERLVSETKTVVAAPTGTAHARVAGAERTTGSQWRIPANRVNTPARGLAPKRTVNPFTIGAAIALAIGGYYAYQGWAPFTWPATDVAKPDAAVVSRPDATGARDSAPELPAKAISPDLGVSKSATDAAPSGTAVSPSNDGGRPGPIGDAPAPNSDAGPGSSGTPATSASAPTSGSAPATSAAAPVASDTTSGNAARTGKTRDRAAIDRDALATQRLIERDLGSFGPAPAAKDHGDAHPSP